MDKKLFFIIPLLGLASCSDPEPVKTTTAYAPSAVPSETCCIAGEDATPVKTTEASSPSPVSAPVTVEICTSNHPICGDSKANIEPIRNN